MQSNRDSYARFIQKETRNVREFYKNKIINNFKNTAYPNGKFSEDEFKVYTKKLYTYVKEHDETAAKKIFDAFKDNNLSSEQKLEKISFLAVESGAFDNNDSIFAQFKKIISNEAQLNEFLTNPSTYIQQKKCSSAEIFVLQEIGNGNNLKTYCEETGKKAPAFKTKLTKKLQALHLEEYTSIDAANFKNCINYTVKEEVLKKAKKPDFSGKQIMGMAGVQLGKTSYTRAYIEETANKVKEHKKGTCQSFTQLIAHLILLEMEKSNFTVENIKIVSHQAALGSHTFLLFGHNSDDLSDLSNCLIVDPWAVAMGYSETNGIFTTSNYPYPGMLSDLTCVYESDQDKVHQTRLNSPVSTEIANSTTVAASVTSVSLFNKPEAQLQTETQKFLTDLLKIYVAMDLVSSPEYAVLYAIKENVDAKQTNAKFALMQAVDVFFNMQVSKKPDNNFTWEKASFAHGLLNQPTHNDSIITAFNKYPTVKELFVKRLQKEGVIGEKIAPAKFTLEKNHIIGLSHIVSQLDAKREFKTPAANTKINGR